MSEGEEALKFYKNLAEGLQNLASNLSIYIKRLESDKSKTAVLLPEAVVDIDGYETDVTPQLFQRVLEKVNRSIQLMAEGAEYHEEMLLKDGEKEIWVRHYIRKAH